MKRSILYLQYTNPANYPPLEHSGLILSKVGWDVQYFGIQSEGESNKLAFPETLAGHVTLWQHQSPGLKQKLHFVAFTMTAWWRALWHRPGWVYCSELMSCPAAWLIGRFTCCRVLYHEHDSPSEPNGESRKWKVEIGKAEMLKGQSMEWKADNGRQTTDDRPPVSSFQRFLLWTRKRAGREAELVVLPNQTRLELFQQTTGRKKPSLCIFNCPRLEEVRSSKTEPCSEGRLRLAFHGSINRDRLPMALLPALAQLQGTVELQIIGYTTIDSSDYLTRFVAEAERLGIKPLISLMGTVPQREKLLELASRADVGLAVMPLQGGDVNMANMTGASNKPFDYLACGLALLVSDLPDWRKMFVEPGYGLACDPADPESIAKALRLFTEHPKETREMGERGRQRILSEWNYESQFAPVINQL